MRAHAFPDAAHRRCLLHGEIDERRAGEIEQREEIEIGGEAEMIGDAGGDQPPDEIARHVAGDVGGKRGS